MTEAAATNPLATHPALLESSLHRGRTSGRATVATLMHAIASGAVRLTWDDDVLGFELVRGVATPAKSSGHGPYVKREHVDGLHSLDRKLLEFLFDHVADSPMLTPGTIAARVRQHPVEYWGALGDWRESVRHTPCQPIGRAQARRIRAEVSAPLADSGTGASAWAAAAALAYVLGTDRAVHASARARAGRSRSDACGPAAVAVLCSLGDPPRTLLKYLDRLLTPWPPSKYLPAQYAGIGLPSWYRARVVDDGSRRLGG